MRIDLPDCVVRSWEVDDAADLALHADNREIWLNLRDAFPHPYSRADADGFIAHCRERNPQTNFAIEVDGHAAGAIGFRLGEDVERVSAEVGYWLAQRYWNRGILTQVLVATRDYAIRTYSLTRIFALPLDRNPASARVLEKAGFILEGRLRRSALKDGEVFDQLMYAYVAP